MQGLDINKIRMMARLASFEKKEGREIREASRYYKGDYIASRIFKSILHYSLCFFLVLMLCLLIQLETIMLNLNFAYLGAAARAFLTVYIAGLAITGLVAAIGAAARYNRARYLGDIYMEHLEKLLSYEQSGEAVKYAREEAGRYIKTVLKEDGISRGRAFDTAGRISGDSRQYEQDNTDWLDEPDGNGLQAGIKNERPIDVLSIGGKRRDDAVR